MKIPSADGKKKKKEKEAALFRAINPLTNKE